MWGIAKFQPYTELFCRTLKISGGQQIRALLRHVLSRPLDLGVRKQIGNARRPEHQTQSQHNLFTFCPTPGSRP